MTLNELGSSLFLKVLRKEMSPQMACSTLKAFKNPSKNECKMGPYGICLSHGQMMSECKNGK